MTGWAGTRPRSTVWARRGRAWGDEEPASYDSLEVALARLRPGADATPAPGEVLAVAWPTEDTSVPHRWELTPGRLGHLGWRSVAPAE